MSDDALKYFGTLIYLLTSKYRGTFKACLRRPSNQIFVLFSSVYLLPVDTSVVCPVKSEPKLTWIEILKNFSYLQMEPSHLSLSLEIRVDWQNTLLATKDATIFNILCEACYKPARQ